MSYRLTETGWTEMTEMTEYEDLQMVGNSDGSVSFTDIGHVGKLTGSCKDIGGKTLACVVIPLTGSTQVVDSSTIFTAGALGGEVRYTSMATDANYRIETWEYVGAKAVQVNGQQATTLAGLFSCSTPVAEGSSAVATVFDKAIAAHSEQYGALVKDLLASVTQPANVAAMQTVFGTATFSAGAKAYINTHSYDDGSSGVEVVLNAIAYQDLLTMMGNPA